MSRSFDYQTASVDAIALHLNTVQSQSCCRLISYYTRKDDAAMLAKLIQARKLAKIYKLQSEYYQEYPSNA